MKTGVKPPLVLRLITIMDAQTVTLHCNRSVYRLSYVSYRCVLIQISLKVNSLEHCNGADISIYIKNEFKNIVIVFQNSLVQNYK